MTEAAAVLLFPVFTLRLHDWAGLRRPPDEHVFTTLFAIKHGGALQTEAKC